jgi:hypothetical protein
VVAAKAIQITDLGSAHLIGAGDVPFARSGRMRVDIWNRGVTLTAWAWQG